MRKVVVQYARPPARPPESFTLQDALALVASLAGACAFACEFVCPEMSSLVALVVSLLVWFVGWAFIVDRGLRSRSPTKVVAGLLPLGAALLLWAWTVHPGRRIDQPREFCVSNIKQLALALRVYHDDYGCFPPAFIADENGRPMHSWRVLILPYLERRDLYDAYDFNEPWDGPNNRRIANVFLEVFRCPSSDRSRENCTTDYFVVVGPETLWPGATSVAISQVGDRPDQTILLVESTDLNVHWSQPVDLEWSQMGRTVNAAPGPSISSAHPGGAVAAFLDGHAEFLGETLPEEKLRRLLTIKRVAPPAGK